MADASTVPTGRHRGAPWRAVLLAGALTVSVLAIEVFLRAIDYPPSGLSLYRPNPAGGGSFRLKPNLNIVTEIGRTPVTITTNSHGMRWPEISQDVEPGVRRVALVGDSFTFGLWADRVESTLAGVAAAALRADGIEVLNFGIPGYGLLDIELQIRQQVLAFGPHDIVLTLYNGNDYLDTYLGLERYQVAADGTLQLDDEVVSRKIPAEFLDRAMSRREATRKRFRLYAVLGDARQRMRMAVEGPGSTASRVANAGYTSNTFWSRTKYPEFAEHARTDLLSALGRIKALCDEHGVRFFLVAVPSIEQVVDPAFFRQDYDIQLPQRHFEQFARAASIPYLDLLPILTAAVMDHGTEVHVQGDGHLNNAGHEVSGLRIAEFIRRHTSR